MQEDMATACSHPMPRKSTGQDCKVACILFQSTRACGVWDSPEVNDHRSECNVYLTPFLANHVVLTHQSTSWHFSYAISCYTFLMPECAIPVNFYQFLHELLRTRALWRKNCQKSFRLLKSAKNARLHCQHVLPANLPMFLAQMQLCQMI